MFSKQSTLLSFVFFIICWIGVFSVKPSKYIYAEFKTLFYTKSIPISSQISWDDMEFIPLIGGNINEVFLIQTKENHHPLFVLRSIVQKEASSRKRERQVTALAAQHRIAPELISQSDNLMLLEYLGDKPYAVKEDAGFAKITDLLRHVHKIPCPMNIQHEGMRSTQRVKRLYTSLDFKNPHLQAVKQAFCNFNILQKLLSAYPKTFCHLDIHPFNIFRKEGTLKLIDWTLAGYDDPLIEVSNTALFLNLSEQEELQFLQAYLKTEHPLPKEKITHYYIARCILCFLRCVWPLYVATHKDPTAIEKFALMKGKKTPPLAYYYNLVSKGTLKEKIKTQTDLLQFAHSALDEFNHRLHLAKEMLNEQ